MTNDLTTQVQPKTILSKPYTRRLTPDESGGYTATIQEFPGCFAEGETAEEALDNLNRVAESWLEVALSHGQEVRDPIGFDGCSGKIALRIPRGLHQQVAELAELEDCSVNQLLTSAIAEYVGKMDVLKKLGTVLRQSMPPLVTFDLISHKSWSVSSSQFGELTVVPQREMLAIGMPQTKEAIPVYVGNAS